MFESIKNWWSGIRGKLDTAIADQKEAKRDAAMQEDISFPTYQPKDEVEVQLQPPVVAETPVVPVEVQIEPAVVKKQKTVQKPASKKPTTSKAPAAAKKPSTKKAPAKQKAKK